MFKKGEEDQWSVDDSNKEGQREVESWTQDLNLGVFQEEGWILVGN